MYLAPELLRGARDASPATDQWSLGLVAFRALAGIEYFGHIRGVPALVLAIATERMPPPSELAPHVGFSPAFDSWFLRSCARAPADRFPDVAAQVAALAAALGNPPLEALAPDGDAPRSPVQPCGGHGSHRRGEAGRPIGRDRAGAAPPRASSTSPARRCGRWSRSAGSPPARTPATAAGPERMNRETRRHRENQNPRIRNLRIRNHQKTPCLPSSL